MWAVERHVTVELPGGHVERMLLGAGELKGWEPSSIRQENLSSTL